MLISKIDSMLNGRKCYGRNNKAEKDEMGFILNGVTLNSLNYTFNLMVFKTPLSPAPTLLQKH